LEERGETGSMLLEERGKPGSEKGVRVEPGSS